MNYIPGLRSTEQYRSRSAPPRRTLSAEYDRHVKVKLISSVYYDLLLL